MKLISKITGNGNLNKKAEELNLLVKVYKGCLLPTKESYRAFIDDIWACVETLNKQYPATKPFEVYCINEYGMSISVKGSPDKLVARFEFATVVSVNEVGEGICRIEDFKITRL